MDFLNRNAGVVALIAVVIAVSAVFMGGPDGKVGATGTRFPNGISADTTSPTTGQVRGTTFTSTGLATFASATITGTLTQSTSNTATTTAAVGCVQSVATSTATPVRLVFNAGFAGSTTYSGSNSNGTVMWQYGTCPN